MIPLLVAGFEFLKWVGIPLLPILLIIWIIRGQNPMKEIKKGNIYADYTKTEEVPKVIEDTDRLYLT